MMGWCSHDWSVLLVLGDMVVVVVGGTQWISLREEALG